MDEPPSSRISRRATMPLLNLMLLLLGVFGVGFLFQQMGAMSMATHPFCGCGHHGNERTLVLKVSSRGVVDETDAIIPTNDLPARLAHYREVSAKPSVSIQGTDSAKYGEVVRVLDMVRQADISRVSVETFFVKD